MYFQELFLAVFIVFFNKICVFIMMYALNTAYFWGRNVNYTVCLFSFHLYCPGTYVLKSEVVGIECLFSSNDQFLIKIYRRIRKSWVHILKMKSATLRNFDVNVPTSPIAYIKK